VHRRDTSLSRALAAAFLDGPWNLDALVERGADALGGRRRRLRPLARAVLRRFPEPPAGRLETLTRFISERSKLRGVRVRRWYQPQPTMAASLPAFEALPLPSLTCAGDLAAWLDVDHPHLAWLADTHRRLRRCASTRLRHYRYTWIPKRSGAYRLLEAPKSRLKAIQRQIVSQILAYVPPHEAAHGFRRGRSVLSNAAPHTQQDVVLRIDLADFFAAVTEARVYAIFQSLGYPDGVARMLAALCCTPTPPAVIATLPRPRNDDHIRERHALQRLLTASHLPQGAPTSPALANLAAFRLDRRLTGLAGKWTAKYTRYADDLTFSGDLRLASRATIFIGTVGAIAAEEDFDVRFRKTRVMRRAVRQQVAGIVVNERPGLARGDLERLEAILYNCIRHGPATQNREAHPDFRNHLAGRVAWVEHVGPATRAARLRMLFEGIAWS
jgi:hypothetical protein